MRYANIHLALASAALAAQGRIAGASATETKRVEPEPAEPTPDYPPDPVTRQQRRHADRQLRTKQYGRKWRERRA